MELYELLKDIKHGLISGDVANISYDSRKVIENSMFVCIKGANADGHDYIKEAIKRGALAIVIDEELELKNRNMTVIREK